MRYTFVVFVISVSVVCLTECFECNYTDCTEINITDVKNSEKLNKISHLSVRGITNLSSLDNGNLKGLKSLDLSRNAISNLSKTFNHDGLICLDLSNNVIKMIKDAPFRTFSSLKVLNLSSNLLKTIETSAFLGLASLEKLDLSRNVLTVINIQCFTPLPLLQSLNISHNSVKKIDNDHFNGLQKLQQLDLSWNNLSNIDPGSMQFPNLLQLLLVGNKCIGGRYELYLGPGKVLQNVDVSQCNILRIPSALTQTIRILRLRRNLLRRISRGDFDSYPLIQVLDLSDNILEIIEEDAFGRLDLLRILYLNKNQLKTVPSSLPVELTILHIENNAIETIFKDELIGLNSLEVLLINDNKIKTIETSAFSSLSSLFTLDISRNPIFHIPSGLFSSMTSLQILKLSQLTASFEPESDITIMSDNLIVLDVSNSPKLAKQLLGNTAFLMSAHEIQKIDMRGTNTENIRNDLLSYLPQLHILLIQDNPLNCSNLQWLASWLRRQETSTSKTIVCHSPLELKNMPLVDLQKIVSSNSIIKTNVMLNNKTTKQKRIELERSDQNNSISLKNIKNENKLKLDNNKLNFLKNKFESLKGNIEMGKNKDKARTIKEGQDKAMQNNVEAFIEQNVSNSRQDNPVAKIAPLTLMNSRKDPPQTQLIAQNSNKEKPQQNIIHKIKKITNINSNESLKSSITKINHKNDEEVQIKTSLNINVTKLLAPLRQKTNNYNKSEINNSSQTLQRFTLAMTDENEKSIEEIDNFKSNYVLITFIFVVVNVILLVIILTFRSKICHFRFANREEPEEANLHGLSDLW